MPPLAGDKEGEEEQEQQQQQQLVFRFVSRHIGTALPALQGAYTSGTLAFKYIFFKL